MCDQTEIAYVEGDIVWVKFGSIFWPAEVQDDSQLPPGLLKSFRKHPIAIAKFFQENAYEYVRNSSHIYRYNCLRKHEFIKKGMGLFHGSKRKTMEKFPEDVRLAEEKTGGDPDIILNPEFLPEERPDITGIFGDQTPKAKRGKGGPGRKSSEATDSREATPTRNYKWDHRFSHGGLLSTASRKDSIDDLRQYKCQFASCDFATDRLNVIILHNKTHSNDKSPAVAQHKRRSAPAGTKRTFKVSSSEDEDDDIDELFKASPKKRQRKKTAAKATATVTSTTSTTSTTSPRRPRGRPSKKAVEAAAATAAEAEAVADIDKTTAATSNESSAPVKPLSEIKSSLLADWLDDDDSDFDENDHSSLLDNKNAAIPLRYSFSSGSTAATTAPIRNIPKKDRRGIDDFYQNQEACSSKATTNSVIVHDLDADSSMAKEEPIEPKTNVSVRSESPDVILCKEVAEENIISDESLPADVSESKPDENVADEPNEEAAVVQEVHDVVNDKVNDGTNEKSTANDLQLLERGLELLEETSFISKDIESVHEGMASKRRKLYRTQKNIDECETVAADQIEVNVSKNAESLTAGDGSETTTKLTTEIEEKVTTKRGRGRPSRSKVIEKEPEPEPEPELEPEPEMQPEPQPEQESQPEVIEIAEETLRVRREGPVRTFSNASQKGRLESQTAVEDASSQSASEVDSPKKTRRSRKSEPVEESSPRRSSRRTANAETADDAVKLVEVKLAAVETTSTDSSALKIDGRRRRKKEVRLEEKSDPVQVTAEEDENVVCESSAQEETDPASSNVAKLTIDTEKSRLDKKELELLPEDIPEPAAILNDAEPENEAPKETTIVEPVELIDVPSDESATLATVSTGEDDSPSKVDSKETSKSDIDCFDFNEDEEEEIPKALNRRKRRCLPPGKVFELESMEEIRKNEEVHANRANLGSDENGLKESAAIEKDPLESPEVLDPSIQSGNPHIDASVDDSAIDRTPSKDDEIKENRTLPPKERGKRIFKSRNRSRLSESDTSLNASLEDMKSGGEDKDISSGKLEESTVLNGKDQQERGTEVITDESNVHSPVAKSPKKEKKRNRSDVERVEEKLDANEETIDSEMLVATTLINLPNTPDLIENDKVDQQKSSVEEIIIVDPHEETSTADVVAEQQPEIVQPIETAEKLKSSTKAQFVRKTQLKWNESEEKKSLESQPIKMTFTVRNSKKEKVQMEVIKNQVPPAKPPHVKSVASISPSGQILDVKDCAFDGSAIKQSQPPQQSPVQHLITKHKAELESGPSKIRKTSSSEGVSTFVINKQTIPGHLTTVITPPGQAKHSVAHDIPNLSVIISNESANVPSNTVKQPMQFEPSPSTTTINRPVPAQNVGTQPKPKIVVKKSQLKPLPMGSYIGPQGILTLPTPSSSAAPTATVPAPKTIANIPKIVPPVVKQNVAPTIPLQMPPPVVQVTVTKPIEQQPIAAATITPPPPNKKKKSHGNKVAIQIGIDDKGNPVTVWRKPSNNPIVHLPPHLQRHENQEMLHANKLLAQQLMIQSNSNQLVITSKGTVMTTNTTTTGSSLTGQNIATSSAMVKEATVASTSKTHVHPQTKVHVHSQKIIRQSIDETNARAAINSQMQLVEDLQKRGFIVNNSVNDSFIQQPNQQQQQQQFIIQAKKSKTLNAVPSQVQAAAAPVQHPQSTTTRVTKKQARTPVRPPVKKQQIVQPQAPVAMAEEPQTDAPNIQDNQLMAVPAENFGGPQGAFFLCTVENNTYYPIDRQPLYLDDNNQLIPGHSAEVQTVEEHVEQGEPVRTEPSPAVEYGFSPEQMTSNLNQPLEDPSNPTYLINTGDGQSIFLDQQSLLQLTAAGNEMPCHIITADGQQIILQNSPQEILAAIAQSQREAAMAEQHIVLQENVVIGEEEAANHDILAAALADTEVFQQEQYMGDVMQMQAANANVEQGVLAFQTLNQATTSETNAILTLPPIMSTLEQPSSKNELSAAANVDCHNLEESLAVIGVGASQNNVPSSLELPITITNPAIAPRTTNAMSGVYPSLSSSITANPISITSAQQLSLTIPFAGGETNDAYELFTTDNDQLDEATETITTTGVMVDDQSSSMDVDSNSEIIPSTPESVTNKPTTPELTGFMSENSNSCEIPIQSNLILRPPSMEVEQIDEQRHREHVTVMTAHGDIHQSTTSNQTAFMNINCDNQNGMVMSATYNSPTETDHYDNMTATTNGDSDIYFDNIHNDDEQFIVEENLIEINNEGQFENNGADIDGNFTR